MDLSKTEIRQAINLGTTNDFVSQVFEFNERILKIEQRDIGLLSDQELEYAIKAATEELIEFEDAHRLQDVFGAVDAVVDLLYFGIGFLKRMGLSEEQVSHSMAAVHYANMSKKLSHSVTKRVEGVADASKPEGWRGPEEAIAEILGG